MNVEMTSIADVKLITPKKYEDHRGHFVENFRQEIFDTVVGQSTPLVQENYSLSKAPLTFRGLHAQMAPHAQGKLVRCVRGKIKDVAVDVRPGSSSYGQSVMTELSAESSMMLWVPEGFLHGFLTLEANTEVMYKCTNYYAPDFAVNVDWRDSDLNLDWRVDTSKVTLSEKDKTAMSFKDFELEFLSSV